MTIMSINSLNNINIVKPENKVVAKLPVENKINVTTNVTTIKDTSTISVKTNCPVPKVSIFELSKNKALDNIKIATFGGMVVGGTMGASVSGALTVMEVGSKILNKGDLLYSAGVFSSKSILKAGLITGAVVTTAFVGVGIYDAVKVVKESKNKAEEIKKYEVEKCKNPKPQVSSNYDD